MKKELSYLEKIKMIGEIKKLFESQLEEKLELIKCSCPLFVKTSTGLQDQLSGTEQAVGFSKDGEYFEIVHSLAKWKREALGKYEFPLHKGIYTDMKAIRKDEIVDDIHSLYVEQWDWEKVISKDDRTIDYLKDTVCKIYEAIKFTTEQISSSYDLSLKLPEQVYFITSQELEDLYPTKSKTEREDLITKDKRVVFVIGIGDKLKSGSPYDLRSPDYDDWKLDGDLLVYDDILSKSIEISSMGIRVDEKSMIEQLEKADCMDRLSKPFHQSILKGDLPYTIGGGIGQSRILMLLMESEHIAEVQASSWEEKTYKDFETKTKTKTLTKKLTIL